MAQDNVQDSNTENNATTQINRFEPTVIRGTGDADVNAPWAQIHVTDGPVEFQYDGLNPGGCILAARFKTDDGKVEVGAAIDASAARQLGEKLIDAADRLEDRE